MSKELDSRLQEYIKKMYPLGLRDREYDIIMSMEERINKAGGSLASRQIIVAVIELYRSLKHG